MTESAFHWTKAYLQIRISVSIRISQVKKHSIHLLKAPGVAVGTNLKTPDEIQCFCERSALNDDTEARSCFMRGILETDT